MREGGSEKRRVDCELHGAAAAFGIEHSAQSRHPARV